MNAAYRALWVLWAAPWAAVAAPPSGATPAELVWSGAALLLVLLAIFALAQFAKRFAGLNLGAAKHLRVLAGIPVGTRERVVLVQVGRKQLVLGVAPGRVERLCELSGDDCVGTDPSAAGTPFEQRLTALVRGSERAA